MKILEVLASIETRRAITARTPVAAVVGIRGASIIGDLMVDERVGCRRGDGDASVDVDVASRRTRHPGVTGARVARGGYDGGVIITIGVDVGGWRTRWRLLMTRQPLLLVLTEDLVGEVLD